MTEEGGKHWRLPLGEPRSDQLPSERSVLLVFSGGLREPSRIAHQLGKPKSGFLADCKQIPNQSRGW